jgi:hypothetical protein
MTLDEWTALTSGQRNELRAVWGRYDPINDGDEDPSVALLEDACYRFRKEYGQHSSINCISVGAARILVTTALYPVQFLEELPPRYCGFVVEQHPINATRDYYLQHWQILFRELLGWTAEQTDAWALRWDDDLNGRRPLSFFYHEDEYYYVIPEIVRASGAAPVTSMLGLLQPLQDAIQSGASRPIWGSPVDWDAVRTRVNAVLAPHGWRLPL